MTTRPASSSAFLNRETSWLEFNRRVLDEARDPKNPLLERLRFFCIFHSNLDEFFMVRVASLMHRIGEGDATPDPAGLSPYNQLEMVLSRVRDLENDSYTLYNEKLLPALAKERIRILSKEEISHEQERYLDEYFDREIYPVLTPLAIELGSPPHLFNLSFNLAVVLDAEKEQEGERRLAVVQLPGRLPGLCRLPHGEGVHVCWMNDAVRARISRLFSGYRILEVGGFRITRDAELELDDEGASDYVRMLESELRKRRTGKPVRLEMEEQVSPELRGSLLQKFAIEESSLLPVKGPLDTRPLLSLVDMPGFDHLRYAPQPPLLLPVFRRDRNIFDIIKESDIVLHHPYESFDPVVQFIQTAARDPDVLAIKQTLYRSSGAGSPILDALTQAAESGKQVTVLVELMARFDEERNIDWARTLEEAGAHVIYGLAGLKVHAKIALVVRREAGGIRRYVHLSTGNYNERTARSYTDFALITASNEFGSDASGFFNAITGYSEPPDFRRLTMAPVGLREKIISLIRREAGRAKEGQISGILGKMNSVVDPAVIQEFYAASNAGVAIQLNVRGICCLRPGVAGLSEGIRIISIVDRYLEHSRAFVFRNGGDTEVYLSSADWMPRSLDRRVELMFPIDDPSGKKKIIAALEAQLADNQKARMLLPDGTYRRVSPGRADPLRAQEFHYRRLQEELGRALSVTPVRLVPLEGAHT
jgi:polyphosphate kinase